MESKSQVLCRANAARLFWQRLSLSNTGRSQSVPLTLELGYTPWSFFHQCRCAWYLLLLSTSDFVCQDFASVTSQVQDGGKAWVGACPLHFLSLLQTDSSTCGLVFFSHRKNRSICFRQEFLEDLQSLGVQYVTYEKVSLVMGPNKDNSAAAVNTNLQQIRQKLLKSLQNMMSKQKKFRPSNEENFLLSLYEYYMHIHTHTCTCHHHSCFSYSSPFPFPPSVLSSPTSSSPLAQILWSFTPASSFSLPFLIPFQWLQFPISQPDWFTTES